MDRHYHPRRRRAGVNILVIRAEGASKAFVFREESGQAGQGTPVRKHRGLSPPGIWRAARIPLAHGQKRHQLSVVLVILGEQSRVISRECRRFQVRS